MKKSILPSILTGGAVIALITVLIVAMVFICLGDVADGKAGRPQQGMPQLIAPESLEDEDGVLSPSFDFNETEGYLELKLEGSTLFHTDSSVHLRSSLRIKELFGKTVTVTGIRYMIYDAGACVHSGYAEPRALLKSTVIGGGSSLSFNHTLDLYDSIGSDSLTVVYAISWEDTDGRIGVSSCKRELSGS